LPHADEIIFQGRTLARRAKDSELVLIKVKKINRALSWLLKMAGFF